MIRKALFLSAAIIASTVAPVTSNAATAVNICVAYDLGGPGDRSYNDAVLAGLTKAKKTLNFAFEGFITDGTAVDREKTTSYNDRERLFANSGYWLWLRQTVDEFIRRISKSTVFNSK